MRSCQRTPRYDQTAIRRAGEGRDGALDFAGIADVDWTHLHSERRRHSLDRAELADPTGDSGIPNDCYTRHAGRYLFE
jgi:hypothetical protein